MTLGITRSWPLLAVVGALTAADAMAQASAPAGTADAAAPALGQAEAMIMLDYQVIPVPGDPSIDLMGFHLLNRLSDWMYLGVGGYAPLVKGEYGGFMAFDVTAHAQRRIWGNLFANAGLSMGAGGGGKSNEQARVLSGTGGFAKVYAGLGYDFTDFSVGANVARMKFKESIIDHTQLNVFVQVPFTYTVGSYARLGQRISAAEAEGDAGSASESTFTWSLDNYAQIDPEGTNKSTIRLVDLQYAHYLTPNAYWFASLGVGYRGRPLYNQVLGGLGYRFKASPRVSLFGQVGVGSGGYAPDTIDTGSGLLVYPKLGAEYAITKNLGLALSAGYMAAPTGSSRNTTYGAALSYHIQPGREGAAADSVLLRGHRFSLFQQTARNVRSRDVDRPNLNMLTGQLDTVLGDHVYVPLQAAIAYNAYLDYPGYGELLAGIGLQSRYEQGDRFQFFGQLLGGTNVHGPIAKADVGLQVGLSDRLAVHASIGRTLAASPKDVGFRADYLGLGLSYRFSVPSR